MKELDFSSKHDLWVESDDGTIQRMDEPYFKARLRAPGTWQIVTSGDYIYLVEGENEALVIDTGYGVGNLREYCQTLTDKPIWRCVNTHEHLDHIGGNTYFDKAYMTEACKKSITDPNNAVPDISAADYKNNHGARKNGEFAFPDIRAINYPLDYEIETIGDGYVFDLGGRELEVICVSDHAAGSLMLLDRKNRLLFSGDELGTPAYKEIRTTVERYARNVDRLYEHIDEIDLIMGGGFVYDYMILFRQKKCLELILDGQPGQQYLPPHIIEPKPDPEGRIIMPRRFPDQARMISRLQDGYENKRIMTYGYCSIIYFADKIFD